MTKVHSHIRAIAALAALVLSAGCTVKQVEPPPLTGPSELALTVRVLATPDTISQDGGSQSSIRVSAIGPNGQPLSGVPIRVDMAVGGVAQDFGTLSARNIVTGSDGTALVVFTAPPAPPIGTGSTCQGLPGTCVEIIATATSTNFGTIQPQTATIRLVPTGVILPAAGSPTASFTFAPSTATAGSAIAFDASASCPEGSAAGVCAPTSRTLTNFSWSFGDGQSGSGKTTTHTFSSPGTYNVTLTVTNDRNLSASTNQQITIGTGTPPTASFVFGPTPVVAGVLTFFNASASTAAPGRTIDSYSWSWGDGTPLQTRAGPLEDHDWTTAGTFQVVLTVTDDIGQKGVATQSVTVQAAGGSGGGGTGGPPTATFTFSPTAPAVNETVFFNASTSTPGAGHTIVSYLWTFGDGSTGTGVTATHAYATSGSYGVQLKTTDETGQSTTSAATTVAVGNPPAPTANFTFSPTAPGRFDEVVFDASSSTTAQGQTIVDVAWNFGDGTAVIHCPGGTAAQCPGPTNRISAHTFTTAQTFVVNLVVTDSAGRTASVNKNVTVVLGNPTVVASASPSAPKILQVVQFNSNATTYFPGSGPGSFFWSFGDGNTSTAANPSNIYLVAGTYTVTLSVTDNKGRTGVASIQVTVSNP